MNIPDMPPMPDSYMYYQNLEDCWKNDLFRNQTSPFDKDFEENSIGGERKYIPECERKPLIQIPIGKQVVESIVSYTFGEDNFPRVLAKTDTQIFGTEFDIETTNLMLQDLLNSMIRKSFLRTAMLKAARHAVSQGDCILVVKVVNSKIKTEIINMKWVTEINTDPMDDEIILSFREVKIKLLVDEAGTLCWFWCGREFNQTGEVIFVPVKADGNEPKFTQISPLSPEPHNLGYCPAVLICFNDGLSVFDNQIDNIRQYSYFESHIISGFKKNMNPQRIWMGNNPEEVKNLIRSSDSVWLMPPGDFKSDSPNPQAYQYAMNQEERLREIILRGCRVVEIPNSNYQSGDALKMKLAPELNLVNETREDLGDKSLVQILHLMLKVVVDYLQRLPVIIDTENGPISLVNSIDIGYGVIPPMAADCEITLGWGEIFISTAQTRNLDVQTAVMASNPQTTDDPLFSMYSVRQNIATHFNVNDMAREQMQIQKEQVRRVEMKIAMGMIDAAIKLGDMTSLVAMLEQLEKSDDNGVDLLFEYLRKNLPIKTDNATVQVDDGMDSAKGQTETSESNKAVIK